MFYLVSKTLDVALSPLWWSLLIALAALICAGRQARRRAVTLGLVAFALLYVSSTGFASALLVRELQNYDGPRWRPGKSYDAVIVLGGFAGRGPREDIELSEASDRLLRGYELAASGRARMVVVVAGGDQAADTEADMAAELLTRWGIAKERILLGRTSRNTRENALEAKELVTRAGLRELVLVTSAFHMQRAAECMRAVGLEPDLLATDHLDVDTNLFEALSPRAQNLALTERLLRELAGRAVYRFNGYARR